MSKLIPDIGIHYRSQNRCTLIQWDQELPSCQPSLDMPIPPQLVLRLPRFVSPTSLSAKIHRVRDLSIQTWVLQNGADLNGNKWNYFDWGSFAEIQFRSHFLQKWIFFFTTISTHSTCWITWDWTTSVQVSQTFHIMTISRKPEHIHTTVMHRTQQKLTKLPYILGLIFGKCLTK